MCGIAGYFLKDLNVYDSHQFELLLNPIRQRGPDDEGICVIDRERKSSQFYKTDLTVPSVGADLPHIAGGQSIGTHDFALIHTRYAIIDLTDAAHQPFVSGDGSLVGIFNGEIYNYIELRSELSAKGVNFRSSSDTEVLIEGYHVWGDELWNKMNGFWAVALYDFKNDRLIFSRDRIGVAPLYYREMSDGFFFSSAIQSLIDIEPKGIDLDNDVVLGFGQTGIKDHDNSTCYRQIKSLPASTTVVFHSNQCRLSEASQRKYWDFPNTRMSPDDIPFGEAAEKYRKTFFSAVELRLRADVKVAFELSGGLDSSSVVAAAALLRNSDITTYTASVEGADEEPYARAILKRFPVDYHVLNGLEGGFENDYESFSKLMEEPYDNPNDYTHYRMLQKMKGEGVSVVVTGAGGDEILAGYEGSFWPSAYRELKNNGFFWSADSYEFCRRFKTLNRSWHTLRHYIADLPGFISGQFLSQKEISQKHIPTRALECQRRYARLSFHEQTLYHFNIALVPYYMRSSDHFTMGIPIEHRFPLLDYRMIELCLQMPIAYLFKNGWTKYLLRKAMQPYLPRKILWRRKKMGFTFPYRQYLAHNRSTFEPLLKHLDAIEYPINEFENYAFLLKTDPPLLWRLLSIAIWIKTNMKDL